MTANQLSKIDMAVGVKKDEKSGNTNVRANAWTDKLRSFKENFEISFV